MAESPARRGVALAEAALAGDRRALARLLTAVENRTPVAESALRRLHPMGGRAHLVGVTGAPGAGKSTLVAALIGELRRAGRTVAVVAVDPSSPITGGALLGDRVRMQSYAADDGVFIRSMASRGHAGGLAATSVAATTVLDAAGFELILLETVGTGQSEVRSRPRPTPGRAGSARDGRRGPGHQGGLLEVATSWSSTRGDRRAPSGPPPSSGDADGDGQPAPPQRGGPDDLARGGRASSGPTQAPEVLVTKAMTARGCRSCSRRSSGTAGAGRAADGTGSGVTGRRRSSGRSRRPRPGLPRGPGPRRLHAETLAAVVRHQLDPTRLRTASSRS